MICSTFLTMTSQVRPLVCLLSTLLGEKNNVDVGENSSQRSNYDSSKKLVQILVILDAKGGVP